MQSNADKKLKDMNDIIDKQKIVDLKILNDMERQIQNTVNQSATSSATWLNDVATALAPGFNRIKGDFSWIFGILLNGYNMYHAVFVRKENDEAGKAARAVQFILGAFGIALGVVAIVALSGVVTIAVPTLLLVSYVRSTVESISDLCHDIYDRVFRVGRIVDQQIKSIKDNILKDNVIPATESDEIKKLSELVNRRNAMNRQIAAKVHLVVIGLVSIAGAAMLFTPLAPIGAAILLGITLYSFMDAIKLNPLRYIAQKISNKLKNAFSVKTEKDVVHDLKIEMTKQNTKVIHRDNHEVTDLNKKVTFKQSIYVNLRNAHQKFKTKIQKSKIVNGLKLIAKRKPTVLIVNRSQQIKVKQPSPVVNVMIKASNALNKAILFAKSKTTMKLRKKKEDVIELGEVQKIKKD